jgi:DNA polymerase-3 subunit alpha
MSLFASALNESEDWSLVEKMTAQQELLGISLVAHPLETLADRVKAAGAIPILDAVERIGQRITVAGIRQTSRRSRTAKGEMMMFLNMEDQTAALDVVLFPDVYRQARDAISSTAPFLVTGLVELDASQNDPYLRAERVERLL